MDTINIQDFWTFILVLSASTVIPFIFEMYRTSFSGSRFLNLGSIDTSGWIILGCQGSPPHGIFSNIPVLYLLNASSVLPPSWPLGCNQSCLWVGGKGGSIAKLPWWRAIASSALSVLFSHPLILAIICVFSVLQVYCFILHLFVSGKDREVTHYLTIRLLTSLSNKWVLW